jgi:alkanesulfonate monooxygenase SsuD/methylene tetrahydromethanopterin reductase-like flavin-dependent oxidoreductase (luciferase family)
VTVLEYHCSHEQPRPQALPDLVQETEAAGSEAAMCSDHLTPWSARQGGSGYAESWRESALEATDSSSGAVGAPRQRHHPVITAQAIVTLVPMYPGRFRAALGSGQAMDEHITGDKWPVEPERNARLKEDAQVLRAVSAGEEVSHQGLVTVDRATEHISADVVADSVFVADDHTERTELLAGSPGWEADRISLPPVGKEQGHFLSATVEPVPPQVVTGR